MEFVCAKRTQGSREEEPRRTVLGARGCLEEHITRWVDGDIDRERKVSLASATVSVAVLGIASTRVTRTMWL